MKRFGIGSLLFIAAFAVSGGSVFGCRAELADGGTNESALQAKAGEVVAIRNMAERRAAHTSTLLDNGKVLITGGFVANGGGLKSAEIFDPATNSFTSLPDLNVARASHTATRLPDGKVLIAGGFNGEYLDTAEIFDPATNRFTPAGRMVTARSGHVATLLNDGRILLAGGTGKGWTFLADAELYDPKTGRFTPTGRMTTERESHTATLLDDGRVLIAGGHKGRRANIVIYKSAEIFDPQNGKFTAAGDLTVKRHKHEAVKLSDGRVLILGGSDERDGDGAYRNAEIFQPSNGRFTALKNNMQAARYKLQGTAIVLKDGKVLIAGGATRAEVFDPATDSFSFAQGEMGTKLLFSAATLLKSGQVLITGGYTDGPVVSSNAWLYRV
jgi:hypothetical protein